MTEKGFTIRRATESDGESARRLIVALGYPRIDVDEFRRAFTDVLARPESIVLLAEDADGQAIGLMTLSHRPQLRLGGAVLCVDELAVIEEARGLGVGRTLLDEAKRIAADLRAVRIELHTNRARESYARGFYVKNGFVEANSAVLRIDARDDRPAATTQDE